MTLNLTGEGGEGKGEEGEGGEGEEDLSTLATALEETLEMMVYPPVQNLATLKVVFLLTLVLKGEEPPTHPTGLEVAVAAACPITTNNVTLNPMNPATTVG